MRQNYNLPEYQIEIVFNLAIIIEKNLRYKPDLISIEDFILKEESSSLIDYSPYYQRKYVWDVIKASFFIESLLLNAEIPPLILFRSQNKVEIIDGRQRYETILKFLKKEFRLVGNGLTKLKHLARRSIDNLGEDYVKILKRIQLRLYEYELHNNIAIDNTIEVLLKQEIFKRYNTGITPLTQLEIFKAKYIDDLLNCYFKNQLEKDPVLFSIVSSIFNIKGPTIQRLLRIVRGLLVLHNMPIYSYANDKSEINRMYEYFSVLVVECGGAEGMFNDFKKKINCLQEIKIDLDVLNIPTNGLLFQTLFWAFSICTKEQVPDEKIFSLSFKKKLVSDIAKNIKKYHLNLQIQAQITKMAFNNTALFFEKNTPVVFDLYLQTSQESRSFKNEVMNKAIQKEAHLVSSYTSFLKKELSSVKICTLMKGIGDRSLNIRPPYQRGDVISRVKSSSIIESLLLGIQLPPIFIYKKKDGLAEVIDGQQRLLSCLSFLGLSYTDENGQEVKSQKNNFALNLKSGILRELDGKRFVNLDEDMQAKILNSLIRIVEINEENNPNFDPVDLFMRLNFKPYPIKDNTFESWNSFIDKKITDRIKQIRNDNCDWLFLSQKNERMYDEELITCLIYFQYKINKEEFSFESIKRFLAIYIVKGHLLLRIANKSDITRTLMSPKIATEFLCVCDDFEKHFLVKIKYLLMASATTNMSNELDEMLHSKSEGRTRTFFRFYILWIVVAGIPVKCFQHFDKQMKPDILSLFNRIGKIKRLEQFESQVEALWNKYGSM